MTVRAKSPAAERKGDSNTLYEMYAGWKGARNPGVNWLVDGKVQDYMDVPRGPIVHPKGQPYEEGSGFPADFSPVMIVSSKRIVSDDEPLPIGDAAPVDGVRWMVSDKAKQALQEIDSAAFSFHPIETFIGEKMVPYGGPPYWLCDVTQYVDALESNEWVTEKQYGEMKVVVLPSFHEISVNRAALNSAKIFRLMYSPDAVLVSGDVVEKLKNLGVKNLVFEKRGVLNG